MCHTRFFKNSRRSSTDKILPDNTDARLAALQEKCRALEDECRALREECRNLHMKERNQVWETSWKY